MEELKAHLKEHLSFVQKFVLFIRTQGVMGLAVAFVIGGAVQKVVTALVNDIINPLISAILGKASSLKEATITIGKAQILWGDFLSNLIDFLIIAFVIYILVNATNIQGLDKKKE